MTALLSKQISEVNRLCSTLSFDFYYSFLSACSSGNLSLLDLPSKELSDLVQYLERQDAN